MCSLQNIVVLLLEISLSFLMVRSECKQSFVTICDSFDDLNDIRDKENIKDVIIGSPTGIKSKNLTAVHLMDNFRLDKFVRLKSLTVIGKINKLETTLAYQCTYNTNKLRYVNWYHNELREIQSYNFPVIALKKMSLTNNNIESIKPWAFKVHDIEEFDVSNNLLEVIEYEALPSTSAVRIITVKNNRLVHIEPGSFPSKLRSLNLDHNKLRYLQNGVLDTIETLEELTLSHNKFNEIPQISNLKNLVIFDISFNEISSIKPGTFAQMEKLKFLDLTSNRIANELVLSSLIHPEMQSSLVVSLALNRLRDLNMTGISLKKEKLVLYGNPFDCNTWDHLKKLLKSSLNECELKLLSSGSVPYCINYRAGGYPFVSQWENDVDRLREVVKEGAETFGCKLNPDRNVHLDPVQWGCVA